MIDENLCRTDLTPAQAAWNTQRRKDLYETLHPETARGTSQAAGMNEKLGRGRQLGNDVDRFTAETAERTGRSERAIQRDAERGRKLGDDLNRIAGTSLDKGVEMNTPLPRYRRLM